MKQILLTAATVGGMLLLATLQVTAQDVGTAACREIQRITQLTVGDEDSTYPNHGAYVSAAAEVVGPAVISQQITAECASCIMNQFARRVPIAEQTACGPATQVRNLLGPETTPCDGPIAGTVSVLDVGPFGLEVTVDFTNGQASTVFETFWTCTTVPNGCHSSACGYTDIGQVTTDAAGKGGMTFSLPSGNPYPGEYVHFDVCPGTAGGCSGPPLYTSLCGTVWPDVVPPSLTTTTSTTPTGAGDPAKH